MFGFKIIDEKKFKKLLTRNRELFIQTKDQEAQIKLLEQEIDHIKELNTKLNSLKLELESNNKVNSYTNYTEEHVPEIIEEVVIKNNYQKQQTTEMSLDDIKTILKPLNELNYFTYRELEIISSLKHDKRTILELAKQFNTSQDAIRENLKNIRRKFIHFKLELFEEKIIGGSKIYWVTPETFEYARIKVKQTL